MEEEIDEMGSLFEGMILFNPSQSPEQDRPTTPSSSSLPLDEDLFSDLTIATSSQTLTLQPQFEDSPSTTTSGREAGTEEGGTRSLNRQVSTRKKKKAGGIRIGYGNRDSSFHDDSNNYGVRTVVDSNYDVNSPIIESKSPPNPTKIETPELEIETPDLEIETPDLEIKNPILESGNSERERGNADASISGAEPEPEPEHDSLSTEEKLEQIRARISEKLDFVRGLALSLSTARKESAKKRRKAADDLNLASAKYKQLEKELEEACESEDFERAEMISENIVAAEKEKENFVIVLREAEAKYDSVDSKMQDIFEMQIDVEKESVLLLEQFAKDAADNAELVLNNAKEFHSKEMGEWLSTVEVLEGAKMELEIQSHLVNDVRMGLTDSIEITVKDSKMEREVLSKKRDVLMEELEMLLSLVRQKEEEIAETNFTIQEVEKKIDDGVSGFFDAQSSIDMKYQNIQTLLLKTHADNEALLTKKGEIEDFLSQKEKRVGKLRELASTSMDEAKACQELLLLKQCLALPIFESREAKLKLAKIEEKILGDIHMLAEEVSTLRASLQELTSTRSTILQEISSSKQRMSFIDKRIPELESQKKVATSSRNFREAGRVTAEVKTLTAERESIQIKTKASTAELEKIEEEIKDTSEKLHGTEELILMKEKDVAMAQWERLWLVAAASKVERSAALKLGDLEEADILLAEAEAFESQAKELQQTYDFKELANSAEELIAMELIVNLEGEQLAEMAASISPTE